MVLFECDRRLSLRTLPPSRRSRHQPSVWGGEQLGENQYVISADEKSERQALSRCHPELGAAAPDIAGTLRDSVAAPEWSHSRYGLGIGHTTRRWRLGFRP